MPKYGALAHTATEKSREPPGLEESFFHMEKVEEGLELASNLEDMNHSLTE